MLKTVVLIYSIVLMALPYNVNAQNNIRTLSPVRIKIELTGKEPRPDGVAAEVTFAGAGAPPDNNVGEFHKGPYWAKLPRALSTPTDDALGFPNSVEIVACGYAKQPTGFLTLPSGNVQYMSGKDAKMVTVSNTPLLGCWAYTLEWTYGMELGLYTLTLDDGIEKPISHTWGMDYGYCRGNSERPGYATLIEPGQVISWLFTGFTPNENMTVHFYADTGRTAPDNLYISEYIATRTFTADSEGAFMLDVSVTRSAPFAGKGIQYRLQDYGDESDLTGLPSRLHPDNLACSIDYEKPQPNRPIIPLYPEIGNLSPPVGALQPNETATVDEVAPRIRNGKVILWGHLTTQSGQQGWILEPDLPGVVQ